MSEREFALCVCPLLSDDEANNVVRFHREEAPFFEKLPTGEYYQHVEALWKSDDSGRSGQDFLQHAQKRWKEVSDEEKQQIVATTACDTADAAPSKRARKMFITLGPSTSSAE